MLEVAEFLFGAQIIEALIMLGWGESPLHAHVGSNALCGGPNQPLCKAAMLVQPLLESGCMSRCLGVGVVVFCALVPKPLKRLDERDLLQNIRMDAAYLC
jgi:hypothetical protein